jgi:hypothetical protein
MSTAFHLQTDGQTERMNRVVEEVLRHFVSESHNNWAELLPAVELAINTTVKKSVGVSPFMLSHGKEPVHPFYCKLMPRALADLTDTDIESLSKRGVPLTIPMCARDESRVLAARRLHGSMSKVFAMARRALA